MELTPELRVEKAVQHVTVFAQFAAKEFCGGASDCSDLLCESAARAFRAKQLTTAGGSPDEWIAEHFSQYMRELVMDASTLHDAG